MIKSRTVVFFPAVLNGANRLGEPSLIRPQTGEGEAVLAAVLEAGKAAET